MNERINLSLIEAMAANLAPYRDDEETYSDTLDGETDYIALLARETAAVLDDRALAAAIKAEIAAMTQRAERINWRADAHAKNAMMILRAADMRKVELPRATVSIRAGSQRVEITNPSDVPTQLKRVKTVTEPDKVAIAALLKSGESVPGCTLAVGDETLSLRSK